MSRAQPIPPSEPKPAVTIVELPSDRWREFRDVRLRALQREPQAFSTTYAEDAARPDREWAARLQRAAGPDPTWLRFAQHGVQVVGLAGAYADADCLPGEAHLVSVYVDREVRGLGVGRALLQALLETLYAAGITLVRLDVSETQASAIALYHTLGFVVARSQPALLGDGLYHNELTMELTFPPHALMERRMLRVGGPEGADRYNKSGEEG